VKESDIPAIRLLVNAAYKELGEMGLNYTATYQDEAITRDRIKKGRAFVLEKNDEIIGTALFAVENYFTERKSGYVSQLAIKPTLKRSGLGTVLMNFCEDLAIEDGLEAIQLDTAKPALHLVNWYQKQGYRIVGETRWEGKTYDSWIFEKELLDSNLKILNENVLEATL
jgi:ribosomal protein S18 acetylase RimI-like enzyme